MCPVRRSNICAIQFVAKKTIADSSALVALLARDDQHHRWLDAHLDALPGPWFTCEAALSEAFYLLGVPGARQLREILRRGALLLRFDLGPELQSVLTLMDKYADVPMSLADACLVRMTEIFPDPIVLTTDSDFRIYRRHGRQIVPALLP